MANRAAAAVVAAMALAGCALPLPFGADIVAKDVGEPRQDDRFMCEGAGVDVPLVRDDAAGRLQGALTLMGRAYGVRVERPDGAPPRILADRLGDGSYDCEIVGRRDPGPSVAGQVQFILPDARTYRVDLDYDEFRGAPRLQADSNQWEIGDVDLGGRVFRYALRDRAVTGSFADAKNLDLIFDLDGDGNFDGGGAGEDVRPDRRFNLGTGTFVLRSVSEDGKRATFAPALVPAAAKTFVGVADAAPAVEGKDLDGAPVSLADYRGREVLLLFWAMWCGPCRQELQEITKGWRQFRKNFGGDVLGVCLDDDAEPARGFANATHVPFRSVLVPGGWNAPTAKAYDIRMIPVAVLVGADGRIKERRVFATRYLEPK